MGRTARDDGTRLDLGGLIELIALAVTERAVRCRLLGSDRVITLRAGRLWDVVPGEIVTVRPRKQWSYAGHPYLSGDIEASRLDARALGLGAKQVGSGSAQRGLSAIRPHPHCHARELRAGSDDGKTL